MKRLAFCLLLAVSGPALAQVDLVRVDKSERKLELLENGKVIREYKIALGDNPEGHKQQEGDERTPEGRYTLDYRNPNSHYFKSIHISYPNAADKANAKAKGVNPGGLIMIHGQPNRFPDISPVVQQFDWTDGCIALSNKNMQELWDLVKDGTPIEISP